MFYEQFPQMHLDLWGCLLLACMFLPKSDMVSNEQIKRKWEEKLKTEKPERIQEEKEGRREKTISQIRCLGLMTLGPHGRQGEKLSARYDESKDW